MDRRAETDAVDPEARPRRSLEEFVARVGDRRPPAVDTGSLEGAAAEVVKALSSAGVRALVLKGPALARLLYSAQERRAYSDIDLLVAPGELPQTKRTLIELGYRNASEVLGIDDVGAVVHEESWVGQSPTGEEARGALLELHLWLAGSGSRPERAFEVLWSHRTEIELDGQITSILDRAGLAMHLAVHAAQHGPAYVKGVSELALGLERWPLDIWQEAAALAYEIEAVEAFAAGLRLVPTGADLARRLALAPTPELDWEVRHLEARPRGAFHLKALLEARGLRARARVIRRALVPPRGWIVWQHPWARGSAFRLGAAYGLHLLRAPALAFSAWRFRRQVKRAASR